MNGQFQCLGHTALKKLASLIVLIQNSHSIPSIVLMCLRWPIHGGVCLVWALLQNSGSEDFCGLTWVLALGCRPPGARARMEGCLILASLLLTGEVRRG